MGPIADSVEAEVRDAARTLEALLQTRQTTQVDQVTGAAEQLEEEFGRRLTQIEAAARSRLLLGTPPSLRELTGISRLEVPMNRVLGWVFDPTRRGHSARAALLELAEFLEFAELIRDLEAGQTPEVLVESSPEEGLTNRQPDLMIRTDNAAVLIENKVDSPESGEGQYADYLAVLKEWAKSRESRAYLFARTKRQSPEGWSGTFRHQELATRVFRRLAEDRPDLPLWDRVAYGLLAGDLDPDLAAETEREIEALLSDQSGLSTVARATRLSKLVRHPTINLQVRAT